MENKPTKRSNLDVASEWFFKVLKGSFIGKFFTSYETDNERLNRLVNKNKRSTRPQWQKNVTRTLENSIISRAVPKLYDFLLRVSLRSYGVLLFALGAVVSLLYPIESFVLFIDVSFKYFVYGIATCVCSLPLMFSSRSLASNIVSSKLVSQLLFDFLGIDKERVRVSSEKNRIMSSSIFALIGLLLGVLSYFVSPIRVITVMTLIIMALTVFHSPETGAIIIIFLTPFSKITFLKACVLYTFACYLFKCFLGKRRYKYELFDVFMTLMAIVVVFFGIDYSSFSGSIGSVLENLIILISFFLFSNAIRTKSWFRRSGIAFTSSAVIVSSIAILQKILGSIESLRGYAPDFLFGNSITSVFTNNDVLAQYIVLVIPFALVHMLSDRRELKKFEGFLYSLFLIATLIITSSVGGIIGFIVGALLLLLVYNRNFIYLVLFICVGIPLLTLVLPPDVIDQFVTFANIDNVSIKEAFVYIGDTLKLVVEHPFGVGSSTEAFVNAYPTLGTPYVDSMPVQLLAQYGIIGIVVFFSVLVMLAKLIFSYCLKAKNRFRKINGSVGLCSIVASVSAGLFNYTWYDKRVLLLFFISIALSLAYVKIEREDQRDALVSYDIKSASVDIEINDDGSGDEIASRRYVRAPKKKKVEKKQALAKEFSTTKELERLLEGAENDEE